MQTQCAERGDLLGDEVLPELGLVLVPFTGELRLELVDCGVGGDVRSPAPVLVEECEVIWMC